jgi:hypothetical protein
MTWTAFLLAALKALPALIQLISALKVTADAKTNQGIGYDQAVADTLKATTDRLTIAQQVEAEAEHDHATKSDDTAFDSEFKRAD